MVAVRYKAIPVVDPQTGLPLLEARGAVGNIVIDGTTTPCRLSEDKAGNIPIQQPITLTPGGYIPTHWNQDGLLEATFVPLSGTWSTPIDSSQGLREAADAAATAAAAAADRAEAAVELADVVDLVAGANVTITQTEAGLEISAAGGGGGGSSGPVTSDLITDATPVGKSILTAATTSEVKTTLGITAVTVGWTGDAAPASEALRKTGTTAQTITPKVTFTQAPVLPAESVPLNRIVGAEGRFAAVESRRKVIVKVNQDDPLPADWREGDVVLYLNPTTTGGGGTTEPPPADTTALKRLYLTGVADGATLTTAGGTGDTPLDAVSSPAPLVQVVNGAPRVHVPPGTTAYTWRWTTGLPAAGVFTMDYTLDVLALPTGSTTFLIAGGVFTLSMNTSGQVTVLDSAGQPAKATVGGVIGGTSPALTNPGTYHVKAYRASSATGTLTKFRLYDPAGALVWDVSRDVGIADPTSFIMGRTGATSGEFLHGPIRLDDSGTELANA